MWKALKSTLKPYSPKHSSELKRWNPCLHRGETAWKCVPKFINLCSKFIKKRKAGTEKASPGGTGRVLRTGRPRKASWEGYLTLGADTGGTKRRKCLGYKWDGKRKGPEVGAGQVQLKDNKVTATGAEWGFQEVRGAGARPGPAGPQQLIVRTLAPNPAILNKTMNAGQSQLRGLFETHVWHSASPIAELPNWAT